MNETIKKYGIEWEQAVVEGEAVWMSTTSQLGAIDDITALNAALVIEEEIGAKYEVDVELGVWPERDNYNYRVFTKEL